jgi:hypothetical protein
MGAKSGTLPLHKRNITSRLTVCNYGRVYLTLSDEGESVLVLRPIHLRIKSARLGYSKGIKIVMMIMGTKPVSLVSYMDYVVTVLGVEQEIIPAGYEWSRTLDLLYTGS